MRYFVTGATGFIGSRVVRQLVAAGHRVVALVRDPARAAALETLGASLHRGDITDKESMRAGMAGADGVFHIAGWYRVGARDVRAAWRTNVDGTRNTLELMGELGIPRGVYTSTIGVFSDTGGQIVDESYRASPGTRWTSVYERTKWVAHYEVAEPLMRAGLPLVIVQPALTYGPGDRSLVGQTIRLYLRRLLPLAPAGTSYVWLHVEDAARAHLLAMERGRPGECYIIGGTHCSIVEGLELAGRITGIPAPRLRPGRRALGSLAAAAALVERVVPLPQIAASESLRSMSVSYLATDAKARRELGYAPRPLEDGLRDYLLSEMRRLGMVAASV